MKRFAKLACLALVLVFALVSCANPAGADKLSPQEIAKVQAVMAAAAAQATPVEPSGKDLTYVDYEIDATVIVEGQSYTVKGAFSYSFEVIDADNTISTYMACKSDGISIKGPDLNYTYTMDYTATSIITTGDTTMTIEITITGNINGESINYHDVVTVDIPEQP